MRFHNRNDATQRLLPLVSVYRRHHGIVLGIPRGGIPIAARLAQHLGWDVAPLFVKKISHPENHEYAIGAVSLHGSYVDPSHIGIPLRYIEQEIRRQRAVLQSRMSSYGAVLPGLAQRTVMIVDDGIATGLTMQFAVEVVRSEHPRCIVIVSPVASMEAVRRLRPLVEDLIILHTPHELGAIGEWYDEFNEVSDEDAKQILSVVSHNEHESVGPTLRHR